MSTLYIAELSFFLPTPFIRALRKLGTLQPVITCEFLDFKTTPQSSRPSSLRRIRIMDPEEAQRLIDAEILGLKTQRNTYARISRLPNEIFVEIFTILQGDDDDCVNVKAWHHIAHVCGHWRHVALESVMLWTKPPTHLHDYTLAMLERSRMTPLRIIMSLPTSEATCTAVLSHIGRIESLIIEHSHPVLQHFQKTLLTFAQEAPLLKTLEITQELGFSSDVFRLSTSIVRQFPSLKALWLADIDIDWMMFPLRSLTSLSLVGLELSENPSWTHLYSVMRQMPSLEHLSFRFDDLGFTSPPQQSIEPLQLPSLRTLVINGSHASVICSFLSNTSFPRLRTAHFDCSFNESPDLDKYSTTIDAVLRLMTKGSFHCLDQLIVSQNFFGLSRYSERENSWQTRRAINFTAMGNSSSIEIPCALMAGLAALPTNSTLQVVRLNLSVDLTSQQFLELFGHLALLESIISRNISSRTIIDCLKVLPRHLAQMPIPFPKVKSLELYGEKDYTPGLLEELCDCLKERHRYGAGLSRLILCWYLTQEEVQRLQEYVAYVDCGEPDKNQDDDEISEEDWDD